MKNVISYTIRSDGQEFTEGFKVKSIVIVNEANRIPRANILLLDGDVSKQDFAISNQDFFKPGKSLEIDLGFESKTENVFKGIVVKISIKIRESNASYLEVVCKHPIVKLTTKKKNRFFYSVTDKDAVALILDEAKISNSINGMEDFTHIQLVQYECSSWDFILSRIEANGNLAFFDNEKLKVSVPSMSEKEVMKCEYGSNVISFDALLDSESQFSQVESKAWSSADQDLFLSQGDADFKNEIGNISSSELAGVLNEEPYLLQHTASLSMDELRLWAKSKATKNELSKITGHVSVRGNAAVYPGSIVELSGFGNRFSGKAFVTGMRHEVTQGNWGTQIQFGLPSTWFSQQQNFNALPAAGILPAINGLQIGVVTQLEEDPENEFRIKVRIPIISNDDEGIWAHQAKSYAGNDYGICFAPEIGDEVVVGFLNEDPRKAVVLGVLHSSAKASPLSLEDDNFQKGIISKNGLKMIWDDEKKIITIATPGGHQIKLDDDTKKISIEDSHQNKIEMSDQGITLQSSKNLKLSAQQNIEMEGINVQCKANGKFTAEGNAGAEVRTSSIAVLKGSLVQIN
jgi:Rhs element Vgr protein